jgi:hypothetical protein
MWVCSFVIFCPTMHICCIYLYVLYNNGLCELCMDVVQNCTHLNIYSVCIRHSVSFCRRQNNICVDLKVIFNLHHLSGFSNASCKIGKKKSCSCVSRLSQMEMKMYNLDRKRCFVGVLSVGVGEERISTGAFNSTAGEFRRICMFYTITSRHILYF